MHVIHVLLIKYSLVPLRHDTMIVFPELSGYKGNKVAQQNYDCWLKNQNCLDLSMARLCNQCQPLVFLTKCNNSSQDRIKQSLFHYIAEVS